MTNERKRGQLVLTRTEGERVIIDDGRIIVTVVMIGRGKVRLGFQAHESVPIYREEIYNLIVAERAQHGKGQQAKTRQDQEENKTK